MESGQISRTRNSNLLYDPKQRKILHKKKKNTFNFTVKAFDTEGSLNPHGSEC